MDNLENKIFKNTLSKKFLYWYRYVDDILACFIGTDRQLQTFLNFINNLHSNIEFTLETEQNNSINFLDLTITKNNVAPCPSPFVIFYLKLIFPP